MDKNPPTTIIFLFTTLILNKSANDYFQNIVSALKRESTEDLVYARREYYSIRPADPSISVDGKKRLEQTAQLSKLATAFWDNADIEKELNSFPENHFPELKDWLYKLKTLASLKAQIQQVFNKFANAPETVLVFFKEFLPSSDREAARLRKDYLLKLQSNKQFIKWHNQIYKSLKQSVPESAARFRLSLH